MLAGRGRPARVLPTRLSSHRFKRWPRPGRNPNRANDCVANHPPWLVPEERFRVSNLEPGGHGIPGPHGGHPWPSMTGDKTRRSLVSFQAQERWCGGVRQISEPRQQAALHQRRFNHFLRFSRRLRGYTWPQPSQVFTSGTPSANRCASQERLACGPFVRSCHAPTCARSRRAPRNRTGRDEGRTGLCRCGAAQANDAHSLEPDEIALPSAACDRRDRTPRPGRARAPQRTRGRRPRLHRARSCRRA
jgi:hypothetical protein